MHGTPKYDSNFKNLEYVNPNAPKVGNVIYSSTGSYDSFNPFRIAPLIEFHTFNNF